MNKQQILHTILDVADTFDISDRPTEADDLMRVAVVLTSRIAQADESGQDHMTREQIEQLIKAVEAESPFMESEYHGDQHWRCVSLVGSRLAKQEGVNPLLGFLFGLFHDSQRENDKEDPDHGSRGANLAIEMHERGLLPISEDMLDKLVHACDTHTEAPTTNDPHAGICYDADRLNLWRVGVEPHRSTQAGQQSCRAQDTCGLHDANLNWGHVIDDHYGIKPYQFYPQNGADYGYDNWDNDEDFEDYDEK